MMGLLAKHLVITAPVLAASFLAFGEAPLLFASAIVLSSTTVATIAESRAMARAAEEKERGNLASALELVYMNMRYGKKSLLASIKSYSATFGGEAQGRILKELWARLNLGQKLPEALKAIRSKGALKAALDNLSDTCATSSSAIDSIRSFSRRLHNEHSYEASKRGGALQKYLTLSMIVSSVLPSFAMFSFVGYSILEPSKAQSLVFMLLITVPLPLAYSVIKARIDEIYDYF
ncbi:MAG: hypothetical protein M1360_04415 [Candidatus Marsarchaeota archaeon]|jgi:hypothetical protein|nr:hypothetical protein [Candidatus Marsarchaeota archaeon]MCL5419150.1 hypothetical protein [Candidatus Marsarchaeota archaeon]